MKKISLLLCALALAAGLTACSSGGNTSTTSSSSSSEATSANSSSATSSKSEATASSAEEAVEDKTVSSLEEYFEKHPATYALFLGGIESELQNTEGMDAKVEVTGNDIVMSLDITEMYRTAGATDASIARAALEETGAESIESSLPEVQNTIKTIEDTTGIEGIRIVYRYIFDSEQVYEMIIDGDGNLTTSAQAA